MSTTMLQMKRCVKCGADVTGQQRMKNAKGEYWCMDCGAKEEAAKAESLVNPCPVCHQPVHAANLVRTEGQYVCEACASAGKNASAGGGKKKTLVVVGVLLIGAAAYAYMNLM